MNDRELLGWRWQITTLSGESDGDVPYRFLGRCLQRVQWLNMMVGELKYTLKPVRTRE